MTGKCMPKKGTKQSGVHIKKRIKALTGRKLSEKHIANLKKSHLGLKMSERHRENTSKAMKGRIHSFETRLKLSIAHRGAKSKNWRGGLTFVNDKIRKDFRYREWRTKCIIRDDRKCSLCSSKKEIQVDHIIPLSFLIGEIKKSKGLEDLLNNCLSDESIWSLSNGRTLCIDCHKKTESYPKSFCKSNKKR